MNLINGVSLPEYYNQIKSMLSRVTPEGLTLGCYVDLASVVGLAGLSDLPERMEQEAYRGSPLQEVFSLTLEPIARGELDKVQMSVNEIGKRFLITVNRENQEELTPHYTRLWELVFRRCLMGDFPFPEIFWDYLVRCLQTVGINLLDRELGISARQVLESLAAMGREAALKGLPTAGTQSVLRMLENKALAAGDGKFASTAHNIRFNLETY